MLERIRALVEGELYGVLCTQGDEQRCGSLVVDNRPKFADDMTRIEAITTTGRAVRLEPGASFECWAQRLLERVRSWMPFWRRLLGVCRLAGPPKMRRKQYLSVQRLPMLIDHPELCRKVELALLRAQERTEFARDWRNRRLGHLDFDRALVPQAHALRGACRESVENALSSLRDVMNLVESDLLGSATAYERTITASGDAESLVSRLGRAASLKNRP